MKATKKKSVATPTPKPSRIPKAVPYPLEDLLDPPARRTLRGKKLLQVAFPLGGIGAGCICLNGQGGLQDFSIRNRPAFTALPDGHCSDDAAFALLHVKSSKPVTRLIEGPIPPEKIYDQGLQTQGYRKGGHEGMPRFKHCAFKGKYPVGKVFLSDPHVPLKVVITGWNPFIPLDDRNSSIPCAILEYQFSNDTDKAVQFEFSYHVSHLAVGKSGEKGSRNTVIPGRGISFTNTEPTNSETFASASLTVLDQTPLVKGMWLRGPAMTYEGIIAVWKEVLTGTFTPNDGFGDRAADGRNGGSVLVACKLKPGEKKKIPVLITWYFPNCTLVTNNVPAINSALPIVCDPASGCCDPNNPPAPWRPYYAGQWASAAAVADYVAANYSSLRKRTFAFRSALFKTTLPPYVIDAISANLAILKSPTVLRQENGNVWGWEGCFPTAGCCSGSCTHVWNYAQAMPNLFPALERTLREQELLRSMDERGHVTFRSAIPDGPNPHDFHAAADGQLGGILKVYRDWQISGDDAWLAKLLPAAQRSLEFCIESWDPNRRGALFEPHHNTYDIEFWGPDGMCGSIYIAALKAMSEMCLAVGKQSDATQYRDLALAGAKYLDEKLFNGEYFNQKPQWKNLRATPIFDEVLANAATPELKTLLEREGPRYQYGNGCLSDGVIGAWMAQLYGIDSPQTRKNIRSTLRSIFQYNFRADLFEQPRLQRPGYAIGHEAGLLLCSWPRGDEPTVPFIYSDEVWTGIEYQVASHLILEGLIEEGLTIVRAARSRYDGHVRNPWNEYECGSYYARAMSSYSLLQSLSGFRYSAASKTLWFGPKLNEKQFTTFFCAASGFGTIRQTATELSIRMIEGELAINSLVLTTGGKERTIPWNVIAKVEANAVAKI